MATSCSFQWIWLANTAIILSLLLLLGVSHFNLVPFPYAGFYCEDAQIAHKYHGDTISLLLLFAITLIGPAILMGIVEYSCVRQSRGLWKRLGCWYGQFVFGLLLLLFIVEAAKSVISEPRPHFLDTCKPDKAINCTAGYITDYKCTNTKISAYRLNDSARSFPSGHSAMGFFMSVFLILFMQIRMASTHTKMLVVPWLQCLTLMWAVFCALSRIMDKRHHWWDVLVGAVTGACLAVYTAKALCDNFRLRVKSEEGSPESSVSSGKTFSTRRLLSSTSSYLPPDEKDVRTMS